MRDLLKQKPEEILKAETPVAYLWRYFLYTSGLAAPVWVARLMQHLERVVASGTADAVKISDYKGNLLKALDSKSLPFHRLCQGLSVIDPKGFEFEFRCKLKGKEYSKTVAIPHTHKEERGVILKGIWVELLALDKEHGEKWNEYCKEYVKSKEPKSKGKDKDVKKHNSFSNNLKTALKRKHLTWNTFHTCISILNVEEPAIGIKADNHYVSINFVLI